MAKATSTDEPTAEEQAADDAAPDQGLPEPQEGPFEGEVGPLVLSGYWVRLSGDDTVPEEYIGHLAQITDSPWKPVPIGIQDQAINGYTFQEDGTFTVQTRDEYNAIITDLTLESFQEIDQNRVGVHA